MQKFFKPVMMGMAMARTTREVQHEILNGNVVKAALILGWPLMLTSLMQTGYNLTDTFWVGHLPNGQSGVAIAALQLSWPLVFLFISFAMGFGTGGTALVAQYTGRGDRKMVNRVSGQMLLFSVILSTILALSGFLSATAIINSIGADPQVSATAISYVSIIFLSMPFMFISVVFTRLLRGWGDTVTPMKLNAITLGINVILDPIMIFGLGGFPMMGVVGAALATLISRSIFAFASLYYLFNGKVDIKISKADLEPDIPLIKKIFRIGLPSSIGMSGAAFGFFILMYIIARVPDSRMALAAYGIGDRIINLTFIVVDGFAFSLTTIIGQNIGAGKLERARDSYWKITVISFLLLWLGSLIFVFGGRYLLEFFTTEQDVVNSGMIFLPIFALGMPFFSIYRTSMAVFGGSGKTKYSMVLSITRLWLLRVPLCYYLSTLMGAVGIWYGMALSNIIGAALSILFVSFIHWETGVIEKKAPQNITNL